MSWILVGTVALCGQDQSTVSTQPAIALRGPLFGPPEAGQESFKKLGLSLVDTDASFMDGKPACAINLGKLAHLTRFRWPFH